MSHTPPSFHLRIPPDLKDKLQAAGGSNGNSLNREILDRLERTFEADPAMEIADALRPFLSGLDEHDSAEAVRMFLGLLDILSRKPR